MSMRRRFTEAQIIGFLTEAQGGVPVKELCRKHDLGDAVFCGWRARFHGMSVDDVYWLKAREAESAKLKELLAESMFDAEALRAALRGD
jgi:putative transposase